MQHATRLPTADSFPLRYPADDARVVIHAVDALEALDASAGDFSRRTGIRLQRTRRWRSVLAGSAASRRGGAAPGPAIAAPGAAPATIAAGAPLKCVKIIYKIARASQARSRA
jgi:hypothetical protein